MASNKPWKHSSKRSSTSVSKGLQCEKCTLENKGHDLKCTTSLEPLLAADEHVKVNGVTGDDGEDRQMNTIEPIQSAMDASLEAL
eukprot:CAMPEP_0202733274 /NCGR_PEP_ID=MMETSP1385-20130828/188084_1 /ASSEMBLY_ACC=CAM_ASM_000861 /TAXON_ID=933848 /ORGANISM="Elphidium margaritaceum" /LENGTH=84 /DNA_ID=CAMNT_0049399603 /DNA_START=493 /DNA_END=747 /DNA_ORIENTATION=+